MTTRRPENTKLAGVVAAARISSSSLALQVNQLAARAGIEASYTHRSVATWIRGSTPKPAIRQLLADVLGTRLGRFVALSELGFPADDDDDNIGLYFPRDPNKARAVATTFWSCMDRRAFLTAGVALSAYSTPLCRWLTTDTDQDLPAPTSGQRVGRHDIEDLLSAADDARRGDSRFGSAPWRASLIDTCLTHRATPLLHGTYTDAVGRDLYSAVAEIARLAGWTAFDDGKHGLAQRHYIQALRLARAAGDIPLACYVLACMGLQATSCGHHGIAIDMLDGAVERGHGRVPPQVLGFCWLIGARVHARSGDNPRALRALSRAEKCLETRGVAGQELPWIAFFTHARLAADAVEIHRDLGLPSHAREWNTQTVTTEAFTRSHGLRELVLATTHLQGNVDLEQAISHGHRGIAALAGVHSTRATDYLNELKKRLAPWKQQHVVSDFLRTATTA